MSLANKFGLFGAFIGKHAILSILITLALIMPSLISAIFRSKFELGLDEGFVPENAPSRSEISAQKEFFGETISFAFGQNRSKEWYMALFGLAKSSEGNMLQLDHFKEISTFYERVTKKTVIQGPRGNFTYAQICSPFCEINDQLQKLMDNVWLKALGQVHLRYPVSRVFSYDVNIGKHVFNRTEDEKGELIGAKYVAFYFTSFSREEHREKELALFEQAVEREAEKHNIQEGTRVELIPHGSNTVSKQMTRGVLDAARNQLIGLVLSMCCYLALHSLAAWLSDHSPGRRFLIALLSLGLPVLSLLSSVGFISIFGFPVSFLFFSSPLLLFSFLLISNGTFQFTSAWCRFRSETQGKLFDASERMANTFDQIGPSFLCLNVLPAFAFLVLFCSLPAANYRIFAAFLALLHLNSALLQMFLFVPLLSLLCSSNSINFRFENGNSNVPFLEETKKKRSICDDVPIEEPQTKLGKKSICNSAMDRLRKKKRQPQQSNISTSKSNRRGTRVWFTRTVIYPLSLFVSSLAGKCAVLSASALLLWLSFAHGLPLLSNGMDYRRLLPNDSSALRGFELMDAIWMDFLQILYIIRRPPNFENAAQFAKFKEFLFDATSLPQTLAPRAHQSWIFDYHRDQLGSDLFAQIPAMRSSDRGVNMTKFDAFINGFPYRAWRSGVHFTLREGQSSPSIEQMVVLVAYNGTRGLSGKRSLINQCRAVAKRFPDFLISVFDTDSRTADIMDTIDPFVWRSLFVLIGSALLVPLLVLNDFFCAFLYAFSTVFVFINLFCIGSFLGFQFDLLTTPSAILIGLLSVQLAAHFLIEFITCWAKIDRLHQSIRFSLQIVVAVALLCALYVLPSLVFGRVPFFLLQARLFLLGLCLALWLCTFLLPTLASFRSS